ncbi:hypothetical protein ACFVZW_07070 [Streptomyces sp. NPDC059567]|uniref:hypothetical protein n=1 Tax=Streptomyces sp. NPDC059567 TaxID=3346867 RepID=UPI0036A16593
MTYPHVPNSPHHSPHPSRPRRPGLSFAVVNTTAFAAHLLLVCSAPDFMAAPVEGGTGIGMLALLLQAVLLVWTAARYDRRADQSGTGGPRTAHELGEY